MTKKVNTDGLDISIQRAFGNLPEDVETRPPEVVAKLKKASHRLKDYSDGKVEPMLVRFECS